MSSHFIFILLEVVYQRGYVCQGIIPILFIPLIPRESEEFVNFVKKMLL
jgi:hypothetical protein